MPTIRLKDTGAERRPRKQMSERTYIDTRYNSRQWRALRDGVIRDCPECVECGRLATVVDHIEPVRLGGSFFCIDNLQAMCASCHNAKSAKERRISNTNNPQGDRGGS